MSISIEVVAPSWASGEYHCATPQQSGAIYRNVVPGSTLVIDLRDWPAFQQWGFIQVQGSPSNS